MNPIRILVSLIAAQVCTSSIAQDKLEGLSFSSKDTLVVSESDSSTFGITIDTLSLTVYTVTFTITDTVVTDSTGFQAVSIECQNLKNKHLVFDQKYTLSDLDSLGYLEGWLVNFSFIKNTVLDDGPKRITLVIESADGSLGKINHKTIPE